jgi:cytochrome c553
MRHRILAATVATVLCAAASVPLGAGAAETMSLPSWAYAVPADAPPKPAASPQQAEQDAFALVARYMQPADTGEQKHVPNSTVAFTLTQIRDLFNAPDWHPDDHPAVPEAVSHGRKGEVFACGYCHLPNGLGRPENASLAGLPAAYIIQQVRDIRSGARTSSLPALVPQLLMHAVAQRAADDDVAAAAEYFSGLPRKPWIRVVEAETVPKTRIGGFMLLPAEGGGTEPIGNRIIEMPEDAVRTELRDARAGFVAYVPPGSIKQGEALVTTGGGGKTVPCGICHGPGLGGLGPVPGIVGRSPSYIARQLYDIQHGTRAGPWSPLMAQVVANLGDAEMVAIVAYLTSQSP